jgi:hypothetical protein
MLGPIQGSVVMPKMSLELRILAVVVGSIVGVWTWNVVAEYRARVEAQAFVQSVSDSFHDAVKQGQQAEAQSQLQERQRLWDQHREQVKAEVNAEQSRRLSGNQRCVGGVVLVVDGSTYGQLGTVGDPVRCNGQYADRPIR